MSSTFKCCIGIAVALQFAVPVLAAPKVVTFKKPAPTAASPPAATIPAPPPTAATRNRIVSTPLNPDYWIGVQVGPADSVLRSQLKLGELGLVVRGVFEGSPAIAAGIKKDDVLLEVTAKGQPAPLKERLDLVRAVNAAGPDDATVTVRLLREGQEHTVTAKPAKRPVR